MLQIVKCYLVTRKQEPYSPISYFSHIVNIVTAHAMATQGARASVIQQPWYSPRSHKLQGPVSISDKTFYCEIL